MPKSLEPNAKLRIVLAGDKGKSPEPTFIARSLSVRDFRRIMGISSAENKAAMAEEAMDSLARCIVGWENMVDPETGQPIPYSPETMQDLLDLSEAMELLDAVLTLGMLSEDERKKLGSQP